MSPNSLHARMIMTPDCGNISPTCLRRKPESMLRTLKSCPLGRNTIRCYPDVSTAHRKAVVFISIPQWPYQGFLMGITPRQGMSNKADLHILPDACEEYMIGRKAAEGIIREVADAVKDWRSLAVRLGISKREMNFVCRCIR